MSLDPFLNRRHRYRTLFSVVPFIHLHGLRHRFRATPQAKAALADVDHPELNRVVHDVYCDMFVRGYEATTGRRTDPLTGLAVVLFAAFMYVFDDEFEARQREPGAATTDVRAVMEGAGVFEVWGALERYCMGAGRWEGIRDQILDVFLLPGFDEYKRNVSRVGDDADVGTGLSVIEYDSGMTLRTAYQVIRLFNGHPHDAACEEQFRLLGVCGKFMDDLSDYRADVSGGNANLLRAFLNEDEGERAVAAEALQGDLLLTPSWWGTNCPRTYARYSDQMLSLYRKVETRQLRLPLDIFLALLGTDRFWRVSTVRVPKR